MWVISAVFCCVLIKNGSLSSLSFLAMREEATKAAAWLFLTLLSCVYIQLTHNVFSKPWMKTSVDCLFQFQEIEHCTTQQCIYKDGKMFSCYCDNKGLPCWQWKEREIILKQKVENGISFSTTVYVYDLGKMLFLIRVQYNSL